MAVLRELKQIAVDTVETVETNARKNAENELVSDSSAKDIFNSVSSEYPLPPGQSNVMNAVGALNGKSFANTVFSSNGIPCMAGTKTLIGEEIDSLYTMPVYNVIPDADGNNIPYVISDNAYETVMHGDQMHYLNKDYTLLSDREKAVFELTLLSKKYAHEYREGDEQHNNVLAKEYSEKVALYKKYCMEHGMTFDHIACDVSIELQSETRDYIKEDQSPFSSMSHAYLDVNRVLSNRAHSMIISQADNYTDELVPALSGDITYEDTLDQTPKYDTESKYGATGYGFSRFMENLVYWAKKAWTAIKDKVSRVVHAPFDAADMVVDATVDGVDYWVDKSDVGLVASGHADQTSTAFVNGIKSGVAESGLSSENKSDTLSMDDAPDSNAEVTEYVESVTGEAESAGGSSYGDAMSEAQQILSSKVEEVRPTVEHATEVVSNFGNQTATDVKNYVDRVKENGPGIIKEDAQTMIDSVAQHKFDQAIDTLGVSDDESACDATFEENQGH